MPYISSRVCHVSLEKYAVYPLRNMPYNLWNVCHITYEVYAIYHLKSMHYIPWGVCHIYLRDMSHNPWGVCHISLEDYAIHPLRNMPYISSGVCHISLQVYAIYPLRGLLYISSYMLYIAWGVCHISLEMYTIHPLRNMPYIHLGICLKSKPILWELCHIIPGDYARNGVQLTQVAITSIKFHYPRLYRHSATSVVLRGILRIHRLMHRKKCLLRNRKMLSIWQLKILFVIKDMKE